MGGKHKQNWQGADGFYVQGMNNALCQKKQSEISC